MRNIGWLMAVVLSFYSGMLSERRAAHHEEELTCDEALVELVTEECEGRDETEGPYPIGCACFFRCIDQGELETQDCIGICD